MNDKGKKKNQSKINPLEAIRDISTSTAQQMKQEVSAMSSDFMEQLLGIQTNPNTSGEIYVGESVEVSASNAQNEEILKIQRQTQFERRILNEEMAENERKINNLKLQLRAIQQELVAIVQNTTSLAAETEAAVMQAPINPGIYHVVFFEKLLEFVQTFRKKIDDANSWLGSLNKRASKRNMWGQNYKKHGASYLLSGEHYVARSAG